jgi:hypothetical protein
MAKGFDITPDYLKTEINNLLKVSRTECEQSMWEVCGLTNKSVSGHIQTQLYCGLVSLKTVTARQLS